MTKEEVSQYIFDKKIPTSFIWENDDLYYLYFRCDRKYINNNPNLIWRISVYDDTCLKYINTYNHKSSFQTKGETIKQCLSEFLYWFELNKHRCKRINYYDEI